MDINLTTQPVQNIPIGLVYPNPDQPRKVFAAAELEDLSRSIVHTGGLMQPIVVVPRDNAEGGKFKIIMGERRWRASILAKMAEIKAIVRDDLNDAEVAEHALIENLLRVDLGLVEEAKAYKAMLDRGYTIEKLAGVLGFNQPWRIQERLNVLKLAPQLLDGLAKGAIGPSQAQEMSRLSYEGQFLLWKAIQAGKCKDYNSLRRMSGAIFDQENQCEMFKSTPLNDKEKRSMSKVDEFLTLAGRLLQIITDEDLETLETVQKSDARACAERLETVEKFCREIKKSLLSNAAKQEVMECSKTVQ